MSSAVLVDDFDIQAGGPGLTLDEVKERYPEAIPFPALTDRERAVAIGLVSGLRNSEIAEKLGISAKTIDTHRGHLLKKLKVTNNVLLTRLAIREGWIKP